MTGHVGRREFITLLGGAALWPLAADAQPAMPVVGFIDAGSAAERLDFVAAFRRGLAEGGYVEGQNVAIEYRWADGHYERLPGLATDLVRRRVDVIATATTAAAPAVKAATTAIPIVFGVAGDPVQLGLVASLNQPGGNATGVTIFGMMAVGTRLELLRQVMPKPGIIAYLTNPNNPNREIENVQSAAGSLGQQILVLNANSDREFDTASTTPVRESSGESRLKEPWHEM